MIFVQRASNLRTTALETTDFVRCAYASRLLPFLQTTPRVIPDLRWSYKWSTQQKACHSSSSSLRSQCVCRCARAPTILTTTSTNITTSSCYSNYAYIYYYPQLLHSRAIWFLIKVEQLGVGGSSSSRPLLPFQLLLLLLLVFHYYYYHYQTRTNGSSSSSSSSSNSSGGLLLPCRLLVVVALILLAQLFHSRATEPS